MKKSCNYSLVVTMATRTMLVVCGLFLTSCSKSSTPSLEKAGDAVTGAAKDAKDAVSDAAQGATEAAGDAADAAGDLAKKAGDSLSEGFSAAAEKAMSALEGVDGGAELLTKVKEFFSSAQTTLQGITDSDSAKASISKLGDLGGAADGLSELTGKLPESARTAVHGLIETGIAQLKVLIEKVTGLPGVADVIKPKLDEILGKLTSMSGK